MRSYFFLSLGMGRLTASWGPVSSMAFLQSMTRKLLSQLCVLLVIWLFRAQSRPEATLTNLQKSMVQRLLARKFMLLSRSTRRSTFCRWTTSYLQRLIFFISFECFILIYSPFREPVLSHPSPLIPLTISKPSLISVKSLNFTKLIHLGWLSTPFL